MQIGGGLWDVSWHVLGLAETFFTAPHTVLYAGIVSSLPAALFGLIIRLKTFGNSEIERSLLTGLLVALLGGGLQVIAGPIDFWWHDNFGFDPFLFTPPHSLLIVGIGITGLGMAIGSVRLLQANRSGIYLGTFLASKRSLQLLVILALTVLWLDLSFLVFFINDAFGMAYTFRFCSSETILAIPTRCDFVIQAGVALAFSRAALFAVTGTLVFFGAKSLLGWRGALTTVALLSAAVMVATRAGFQASVLVGGKAPGSTYLPNPSPAVGSALASFIPLYLLFLVPVLLFDMLLKDFQSKWKTVLASVLIGPFTSMLAWANFPGFSLLLIAPMVLGGFIAGLLRFRFANPLLSKKTN